MDPFTMAMIGNGILQAGGAVFGQERANKTNINLSREQMAFQERMANSAQAFSERMSNTEVQRHVADLKAAGLNPALAYGQTGTAPTGVTAGGSQGRVENSMRDLPQVLANSMALKQMQKQLQIADETLGNIRANTDKTKIEGKNAQYSGDLLRQSFKFNAINQPFTTQTLAAEAALRRLQIPGQMNAADFEKMLGEKLRGGGATAKGIFSTIQALRSIIKD